MDELLSPVKSTKKPRNPILIVETKDTRSSIKSASFTSPQDALVALKNEPDISEFKLIIKYLRITKTESFNIWVPSALSAEILRFLIQESIPTFWPVIRSDSALETFKNSVIGCLRSVNAIGALVAALKTSLETFNISTESGSKSTPIRISTLIELLNNVLLEDDLLERIWNDLLSNCSSEPKRLTLWKEFISLIATGKVISTIAQAQNGAWNSPEIIPESWLSVGKQYSAWLARNTSTMLINCAPTDPSKLTGICQTLGKALSIGYSDTLIETILETLAFQSLKPESSLRLLIGGLHGFEKRQVLSLILTRARKSPTEGALTTFNSDSTEHTSAKIGNYAAFLRALVQDDNLLTAALVDQLIKPEQSAVIGKPNLIRAIIASLSSDQERMQLVLERSMEMFSDQIFIKHSPILVQEAITQVLLISSGYIHRTQPMLLYTMARSSGHMNGISKRLSSSSVRVRWLAMIVGVTISSLVDKPDSRMTFTDETLNTKEGQSYIKLASIDDKVPGDADYRLIFTNTSVPGRSIMVVRSKPVIPPPITSKSNANKNSQTSTMSKKIQLIEEEDLVPYAKPDSDPEDEDEDPNLVNRNKPKPPVYIRDLILGLRETEDYEKHRVSFITAASLIRRKTNFGKEVLDNLEELTSLLVNLNDTFEMDDFLVLRQEALISILLVDPAQIAPYFSRMVFEGDFSIQQRMAMLTAIGLGARELAGLKDDNQTETQPFPSRQLPEHLHKIYSSAATLSLDNISIRLEQNVVEPMALKAADELTGPSALKVRTFSSRIAVEKARKRPIPNELAKIVADNFFFPLTGRWWFLTKASGRGYSSFSTHLLPAYLRTLALLLHASGPSTLSLSQMTSEFWDVLMSIQNPSLADRDYVVLEAVLFGLLMLLEVNQNKEQLASDHPKELLETQEWARLVLETIEAGDDEGERVRGLAATVVVRCFEIVQKWQRLLVGNTADF